MLVLQVSCPAERVSNLACHLVLILLLRQIFYIDSPILLFLSSYVVLRWRFLLSVFPLILTNLPKTKSAALRARSSCLWIIRFMALELLSDSEAMN